MMPSLLNANMLGVAHLPHPACASANDAMLDELSRQLHAENARRYSRGSGGCPRGGNAMRINKPGSANNSPRSAMMQSRRKTLIGEGLHARPHLQPVDASYLPTPASEIPHELVYERESRPTRPVSWHQGSYQLPQQQQQQQQQQQSYPQPQAMPYAFPQYTDAELFANYQQLPPTPAAYSAYTSPSSTFSPLSLPYSNHSSQQYYSPVNRSLPSQQAPTYPPTHSPTRGIPGTMSEIPYLPAPRVAGGPLDWNTFASQGFSRCSAPPTPKDFGQPQKPGTKLASEDSIPYQSLEDDDSDGEILYGMGLYDGPDKDPILDFHRSTVFSLLGSAGVYPEPTGKGLKLEDAWEPPVSDDEDDGEGGEDDAEGEDHES